jgi:chromosome segregation ATPase
MSSSANDQAVAVDGPDKVIDDGVDTMNECSKLALSDEQAQRPLYDVTRRSAEEGEKSIALAFQVEKYKDEVKMLKAEIQNLRTALLRGINGGVSDSTHYVHVDLVELLRLRIQEVTSSSLDSNPRPRQTSSSPNSISNSTHTTTNESSFGVVLALEQQIYNETQQKDELHAKYLSVKSELEARANEADGVENLRHKVSQMGMRLHAERQVKIKAQTDLADEQSTVKTLSNHIEKLMVHLKHVATDKTRTLAELSRLKNEIDSLTRLNAALTKKNERKDQAIAELIESTKPIEGQMRIMEEKYIELRSKLEWTRTQMDRALRKKDKELREKDEELAGLRAEIVRLSLSVGDEVRCLRECAQNCFSYCDVLTCSHGRSRLQPQRSRLRRQFHDSTVPQQWERERKAWWRSLKHYGQ